MNPNARPSAMEYDSGVPMIVRNVVTPASNSVGAVV